MKDFNELRLSYQRLFGGIGNAEDAAAVLKDLENTSCFNKVLAADVLDSLVLSDLNGRRYVFNRIFRMLDTSDIEYNKRETLDDR